VFLEKHFEAKTTKSSIPSDLVEQVYNLSSVRPIYDHFNHYKVFDIQILCCMDAPDACDRPDVHACLEEKLPIMKTIRSALEGEYTDLETLEKAVDNLSFEYPELRTQTYSFFWDPKRPPDAQSGFYVINVNVALAVLPLEIGELAEPVTSKQGVHMPYLTKFEPEEHRSLDDPEVVAEIRENIFPTFRKDSFAADLEALILSRSVVVHEELLDAIYGADQGGAQ
jgi:hypothetical protein